MPLWSMNDGSALTGTHTFTQNSADVQSNAAGVYKTEVNVGDIITSAGGEARRVASIEMHRVVPTSGVNTGANSFTFTSHGYEVNQAVNYHNGGGAVATGLVHAQKYYIKAVADANTFTLSATVGGDTLPITGTGNNAQYFIGESNTGLTLESTFVGSTESGVNATVRRPPSAWNTAGPLHLDSEVLGLDSTEVSAGDDNVTSVAIVDGGSGYLSGDNPGVSFTGGGGSSAAASATKTGGKVTSVAMSNVGSSYETTPTVAIAAPSAITFNAQSAVAGADITLASHTYVVGDQLTYSRNSGTVIAELEDYDAVVGGLYVVAVDSNDIQVSSTLGGTAIVCSDGLSENHTMTGITATATASRGMGSGLGVVHPGWVKRTVGTGGKAGRVHYETLVAAGSMSGDASDDLIAPDS